MTPMLSSKGLSKGCLKWQLVKLRQEDSAKSFYRAFFFPSLGNRVFDCYTRNKI